MTQRTDTERLEWFNKRRERCGLAFVTDVYKWCVSGMSDRVDFHVRQAIDEAMDRDTSISSDRERGEWRQSVKRTPRRP